MLCVVAALSAAPVSAQTCDEISAQDLNSRIETALTLQETAETVTAEVEKRIIDLRSEFAKVGELQTQALDSGDSAKLEEVCRQYEEILGEVEALNE